ncbi:MAG: NAD(P)-binding domain-containing protein [Gemmatimonadaceae bacterium]|nr:NAD(P)-binding domain-containing protein [Gemmatimonadaceae bacterium]
MSRVAILGMGLLGSGFAEGLLSRGGTEVVVWNRTASKTEPLVALGATAAESPAEAVRGAERVHLVLLDDGSVDAVIADCQAALHPDAIIIDHTTNLPARVAARAAALDAVGIRYLHAPVMMGPGAARSAKGLMLVAGPTDRVAAVREALVVMTEELWHVGERADLAAAYKLFGNASSLSVVGVLADVMRMADAAGVPRSGVLEMLAKVNLNGPLNMRGKMMVTGEYEPNFTLDVARKDLRLMLETAAPQPTPMLAALAAHMDAAIAAGLAKEDFAVLGKA